jgi:iron complex outermembrane receptor protein
LFSGSIALAVLLPVSAFGQTAGPADPQEEAGPDTGLTEVIVTARRRAENIQTVPVSVSALSSGDIESRGVLETTDLNVTVPGFRLAGVGGKSNMEIVLRGLSQTPLGEGTPATVIYLDEVPLPNKASNIGFYDLANIQVLKGPQGTLFGRNTLGGAVLVQPRQPTFDFGGYVKSALGNYNYRLYEGALNIPVINDKVALRLAGQVRRRNGFTRNLSGGADFDDLHQDSFRAIVLVKPDEGIENTLTFDFLRVDEQPAGSYLLRAQPGVFPGLSSLIDPGIAAFVATQRAAGFHTAFTDLAPGQGISHRKQWALQNKTEVDIGGVTLRNIFSYREVKRDDVLDPSAVGVIPTAFGPFYLYSGEIANQRKYMTEEFQATGKSFDKKLTWIAGTFYSLDTPDGINGTVIRAFSFSPQFRNYSTALVRNRNFSLFALGGLDLSSWVIHGLTLNVGIRESWDKVSACSGGLPDRFVSEAECEATAALNLQNGFGIIEAKGSAPSWTIGLDYKVTNDLFLYVTSRRGYRGVNVNTPLFQTPYTTGGVAAACTGPGNTCPDLRKFQTTKPEKLTDFEVGVKSDFRAGDVTGRFNVAAFFSKYKDGLEIINVQSLIYPNAPDFPTQGSVGVNAANDTIWGIESEFILKPIRSLSLTLSSAYTHAKVDSIAFPPTGGFSFSVGDVTLPSPRWTGGATVAWTLPVRPLNGAVTLSAEEFVTTKYGADFGRNLPGYDITNARLEWSDIGHQGLELSVYVRNLFQKNYLVGADVLSPAFPINSANFGEPRLFAVEVDYHF